MSTDDFLDGLRGDWQGRTANLGDVTGNVARGEEKLQRERRGRIVQILLLGALCIWFFWQAWARHDILFHLGGVAVLTAVALAAGDYIYLRRNGGAQLLGDPAIVLANAERQARIAVRLAEALLAQALLLLVCATIAIGFVLWGLYPPPVVLIGLLWIAAAGGVFLIHRSRRGKALAELREIQALQEELAREG